MIIDTHCHLDFDRFDDDRDAVVARAAVAGVTRIVIPAIDRQSCAPVVALAQRYAGVYAAVGFHPNATADFEPGWLGALRDLAQHPKVVAIGEIGLDYYWKQVAPPTQQLAFARQLALAAELGLPVIVHNRESSDDVIRLLRQSPLAGREGAGVLHSFSADWQTAVAALDLGFYLGFTGPVTYKKADDLRQIVAQVPLDRLLVETDAPFLTPHPYRGKRNEPAYTALVLERIAAIRGLETAVLAAQTTANAERLFTKIVGANTWVRPLR